MVKIRISGPAPRVGKITIDPAWSDASRITRERLAKFRALHDLLEEHRESWTATYPNLWLAITKDGVEITADAHEALLAIVGHERIRSNDMIIEYMDTNPPRVCL